MSNLVTTILSGVKTRVQTVLGVQYNELLYTHDIAKNSFKKSTQRFGVKALDAVQVSGVNSHYTVDHRFQVVLTSDYKTNDNDDSDYKAKILVLQELAHDIFVDLYQTKCGAPSVVMNVRDIAIDDHDLIADDKVITLTFEFLVTYRNSLL